MCKLLTGLLSIFFVLLTSSFTQAQVFQQWERRYGSPGFSPNFARKVVLDTRGNVYVTGDSYGNGTSSDYATIKYNSSGVQRWSQRYNGISNSMDVPRDMVVDEIGNVYVTGYDDGNIVTVKYDSAGVEQWVRMYNGPANGSDRAFAIALDDSNNIYLTGYSLGTGTNYDIAIIKYNTKGVQQWVKIFNGTANSDDVATSIVIDNSGNVIVCGVSEGTGTNADLTTIKYNPAGVQQWIQIYNGPENNSDAGFAVALDNFDNVIVTGNRSNGGSYDAATIKYNSAGIQQWVQIYNGPANNLDFATSVKVDSSGNIYISGSSVGNNTGEDILTIKYSPEGFQQWVRTYNYSDGDEGGVSLALDKFNNVYITGHSETINGLKEYDYNTIKYNSSGLLQWDERYNGPGNGTDASRSIAVDNSGSVYVTGYSLSSFPPVYEFLTIKYSQITNITNENSNATEFSLYQNYPNPFNPSTSISFDLPKEMSVTLNVYDVNGKEVAILVNNQFMYAGKYNIDFEGSKFATGVYFYKLIAGNFIDTKRMILVK